MSLKEIAERVGVSASTVSRVLNNKPGGCVSDQVREQVWAAAQELGYQPNLNARKLKAGAFPEPLKTISIIMTRSASSKEDPFFQECCNCIRSELLTAGFQLGHLVYIGEENAVPLPESDGYLILGRCPPELLLGFQAQSANLVGIWRNPAAVPVDEVVCSGQKAAELATEYLIELGHRKIAYIGDCSYENRFIGYSETLVKHHIPLIYSLVHDVTQTRQEGMTAMEALLHRDEATAVLCANDETALGALAAMKKEYSRELPVSIISIDDIAAAAPAHLTTIHIPGQDMAHLAVALLADRIRKGHREFVRMELPCRLVERDTCFFYRR